MKKKSITTGIIKNILDIYYKKYSNVKDFRVAALCSLAFAGFLRYDELCNIVLKHIEFHDDYMRFSSLEARLTYKEKGITFISVLPVHSIFPSVF